MGHDVRDFRRFVEGKASEESAKREVEKPLLPQEETQEGLTGHPEFDKMVRIIQSNIEAAENHLNQLARATMVQVNADMKQKMTLEYMLAQGMVEAYKAIQLLPAAILKEQRPN